MKCFRAMAASAAGLMAGSLMSCNSVQLPPPRPVYKDAMTVVELRSDPRAGDPGHSHPFRLPPERLMAVLSGIHVQMRGDPIISLITGKPEPVPAFSREEVLALAPALSQALETASPGELVTFYRRVSDRTLGLGFTSGGLFVEHQALCFILANHRNRPSDAMSHTQAITYEIDPVDDPLFSMRAMSFAVSFSPPEAVMPKALRPRWDYVDEGKVVVVDLERLPFQPNSLPPAREPKTFR